MPIEIEAKMRVLDANALSEKLNKLTDYKGSVLERNIYLDSSDHQLRKTDQGLRVRAMYPLMNNLTVLDVVSDSGTLNQAAVSETSSEIVITYKGPRNHGELKNRRELELNVDSSDDAVALLGGLGYAPALRFEKLRGKWYHDDCEITLDRMPHLGDFMEIEGPSNEKILSVRNELGLDDLPLIQNSYAAMLRSHLQNNEMSSDDWVRFD